jgi:hypothetical protein
MRARRRGSVPSKWYAFIILAFIAGASATYLTTKFPICLQLSCYVEQVQTHTVTVVITTSITPTAAISAVVTNCTWNYALDRIEFTISLVRNPTAPNTGTILMLYNPNGVTYSPGGTFSFGGALVSTTTAAAMDSGFDRNRACIVSEWTALPH